MNRTGRKFRCLGWLSPPYDPPEAYGLSVGSILWETHPPSNNDLFLDASKLKIRVVMDGHRYPFNPEFWELVEEPAQAIESQAILGERREELQAEDEEEYSERSL
jgi:hypothetical protein